MAARSDSVLYVGAGEAGRAHNTGSYHPERAARLDAVDRGVRTSLVADALVTGTGRQATREELLRVHRADYLDRIESFIRAGGGDVDPDTPVCAMSWDAALYAAGGGLAALAVLEEGGAASAFVAVRPPGHHATPDRAMGFCLLNNVAVTAAALAGRGERVLIVDWDVHHGNGTQDIFYDDPRVLYVSTHQWPCYPGTGRPTETGGPHASGTNINIPLPLGATGDSARAAIDLIVAPAVERFSPTWVLVSAGFDAHRADPLASFAWTAGDFADLASTVASWAEPGRLVAFLEGGYDLDALSRSAAATVAAFAGVQDHSEAPSSGGPGRDIVESVAELHRRAGGA